MPDDDQLQQLADRIRAALPATYAPDGPYGGMSQATLMLFFDLAEAIKADPAAAALVAAAEPWQRDRFAHLAVTAWSLGYPPIREAIHLAHDAGSYLRPAPTRVQAGFATRSMTG